jgi:thioredoxin-like negative regulator of GroEL
MNLRGKIAVFIIFLFVAALLVLGPKLAVKGSGEPVKKAGVKQAFDKSDVEGRPVFLIFYSEACSICAELDPILKKFEKEFSKKIAFVWVDANAPESADLVREFGVDGLPSFFWLTADRRMFDAAVGAIPPESIRKTLEGITEFQRNNKSGSGMPPGMGQKSPGR